MPSFTVHLLLPLLYLLAWRGLDRRKVWALLPLTFLPDADYFFGLHRATLTNVFILLPSAWLMTWGRLRPASGLVDWGLVSGVYLGGHLLLDAFVGGIVPFYPFSTWTLCLYGYVEVVTATNTPRVYWGDCSHPGPPVVVDVYTWLDFDEAAMLAATFVAAAVGITALWVRRRRGRGAA